MSDGVVIVSGVRTAIGTFGGSLAAVLEGVSPVRGLHPSL